MGETIPSQPKPKKMVSRNVAVALGIMCIILIAGLGVAVAYYTVAINNQDSTYNDYVSTHMFTNAEYNAMWAPKLIEVDFGTIDFDGRGITPNYLNVKGYVVNVHEDSAYNCSLHLIGYRSGGVIAIDTHIPLGTIAGESSTQVNSTIYYTGNSIITSGYILDWNATQ